MNLLETSRKVRLRPTTECREDIRPLLEEIREELGRLRVGRYDEPESRYPPFYRSTVNLRIIETVDGLRTMARRFREEAELYGLITLDIEGNSPVPDLLLVKALGGDSWAIWIRRLSNKLWDLSDFERDRRFDDAKRIMIGELQFLFEILENSKIYKVGVDIKRDVETLAKFFRRPQLREAKSLYDSGDLFRKTRDLDKDKRIYDHQLLQRIGEYDNLGMVALVFNGYNHKCYDKKKCDSRNICDYRKLPYYRKTDLGGVPWMYVWNQSKLEPRQQLYLNGDMVTPLRQVILTIGKMAIHRMLDVERGDLYDSITLLFQKMWPHRDASRKKDVTKIERARAWSKQSRTVMSRREQEQRASTSRREQEPRASTSRRDQESGRSTGHRDKEPRASTSRRNEETRTSTGKQDSDRRADRRNPRDSPRTDEEQACEDDLQVDFRQVDAATGLGSDEAWVEADSPKVIERVIVLSECGPESEDERVSQEIERTPSPIRSPTEQTVEEPDRHRPKKRPAEEENFSEEKKSRSEPRGPPESARPETDEDRISASTEVDELGDSGMDSELRYTVEEREGVRTAREWRSRFEVEKHPADAYLSGVPLLERYRDPTRYEDPDMPTIDRKDTAKRRQDREIKQMDRELESRRQPEYLVYNPIFVYDHCRGCGGFARVHHHHSIYCPVVRYHKGLKIPDRYTGTEFFGVFPCQYCMSCHHTTPVCPVLHALCSICHERGHTHNAHLTGRFNIEVERRRFRRFSALGFRTHSATVNGVHISATKWGSKPNLETHDHPGQLSPGPHRTDYSAYVVNANPSPPDSSGTFTDRILARFQTQ